MSREKGMIKSESEQPIENVDQDSNGRQLKRTRRQTIESGLVNPITPKVVANRQTNKVTQEVTRKKLSLA